MKGKQSECSIIAANTVTMYRFIGQPKQTAQGEKLEKYMEAEHLKQLTLGCYYSPEHRISLLADSCYTTIKILATDLIPDSFVETRMVINHG